jgi:acetyl esterase
MAERKSNAVWLSQMAGKQVEAPRRERLQDLIDSRPFWDSLADLDDLPEGVEVHENVPLWDREGGLPLTAEIYVPEGEGPFPLYLHIHGGGFCVSTAKNDRKWGMQWAKRGYTVINPDYGLSPEHPFPWAVEQCLYTARWITKNAAEYKGDPSRMVIEGGSAGGGLTAATLVALCGETEGLDQGDLADVDVNVVAAVMFYGIHDFTLLLLESGSNVGSAELWNRAYLGPHFTTKLRHPLASQVYSTNLSQWPPTYISCGMQDSLLGHSLAMAKALAQADAPATLSVIEGADHGYAKMAEKIPNAAAELERIEAWLEDKVPAAAAVAQPA